MTATYSEEFMEKMKVLSPLDAIYMIRRTKTCHKHRVMRCNLKPENFLSANKKETSPLKVLMNQRLMFGVMQLSSIFYFVVSYHYGQVGLSLNEVFAFVHLTLWRLELKTAIEAVCAFRACGQKIREIS